jgi:Plasmid pRiA4b ORF-3-like protein
MPKKTASAPSAKERNYIILVQIQDIEHPRVTRTFSIPPSTTFYTLHLAIQIAFGWQNQHCHNFEISNIPAIWLDDEKSPPKSTGPRTLLTIGNTEMYSEGDDTPSVDERTTKLSDVFEQEQYKNKYVEYMYDFGDSWEHSVVLFGRAEECASPNYLFCLGGEGAPVAENCGGVDGWEGLKEAITKSKEGKALDDDEKDLVKWFKKLRKGNLDVWDWDMAKVNTQLESLDNKL